MKLFLGATGMGEPKTGTK